MVTLVTLCSISYLMANSKSGMYIQRGPSARSPGFEDDDLGNSTCCWAVTAVRYCPSRHLQLTEKTPQNLGERSDGPLCT